MTSNDNGSNTVSRARRIALTAAVTVLASSLAVGCGGGGEKEAAAKAAAKAARSAATADTADTAPGSGPANAQDKRLADAVVDGKTTAPVDMKYDILAKPALGQPFEVELTFKPRLPAESLTVELSEAAGLTIVGEKTTKFAPVETGQSYTMKVLVQGDTAGLYFIGIVANMATQVQTETRAFAVPVSIGDPALAQKTAPMKDATGQAVQSMPAQEPK